MNVDAWLAPPLVVPAPWLPPGAGGGQIKATPDDFWVPCVSLACRYQ